MEKEQKKHRTGIYFPCTESQKRKIKDIAVKCGLGQGEYILKRALGYEPKTVLPYAFFVFHDKLCKILDSPPTPDNDYLLIYKKSNHFWCESAKKYVRPPLVRYG